MRKLSLTVFILFATTSLAYSQANSSNLYVTLLNGWQDETNETFILDFVAGPGNSYWVDNETKLKINFAELDATSWTNIKDWTDAYTTPLDLSTKTLPDFYMENSWGHSQGGSYGAIQGESGDDTNGYRKSAPMWVDPGGRMKVSLDDPINNPPDVYTAGGKYYVKAKVDYDNWPRQCTSGREWEVAVYWKDTGSNWERITAWTVKHNDDDNDTWDIDLEANGINNQNPNDFPYFFNSYEIRFAWRCKDPTDHDASDDWAAEEYQDKSNFGFIDTAIE